MMFFLFIAVLIHCRCDLLWIFHLLQRQVGLRVSGMLFLHELSRAKKLHRDGAKLPLEFGPLRLSFFAFQRRRRDVRKA